ncbi:hypothetical protein BT93_H3885 [Corymbia citriodora subsp. variegata]|nr:hypothetical protein BT93_H3885 [Corymbia citriodora subsp. variegata]
MPRTGQAGEFSRHFGTILGWSLRLFSTSGQPKSPVRRAVGAVPFPIRQDRAAMFPGWLACRRSVTRVEIYNIHNFFARFRASRGWASGARTPDKGGGFAEFAIAKENLTVARPPEVSAPEGAGLPVAGLTALQALTQAAGVKLDRSGLLKNILITAASGGVGHYAVQLAKLGNTHVTATCGARNIDFVKGLGADEVLDYKTPEGAALKSPSGKKYDFVLHCAHAFPWSVFEPNLSEHGKVIDITPGVGAMMTFALKKLTFSKKQLVPLLLTPKGENLEFLVKLVKEGKLKTVIDSTYPLSNAEDAWAKSIDGHATGKVVIEP